jgi:uncharacterized repeat protein (TIGR01451 family)
VLLAFEDPSSGLRTVSQNFLTAKHGDLNSIAERKRLFWNAVWWLLRRPVCGLTEMAVSHTAGVDAVPVGQEVTYSIRVSHSGECQATAVVVTDELPAGVTFVSATSLKGVWTDSGGVVTFSLAAFERGEIADLTVTVIPTVVGLITNVVKVRSNERDPRVDNNTSVSVVTVQALTAGFAALRSASGDISGSRHASLSIIRTAGTARLELKANVPGSYIIETSTDLINWSQWRTETWNGVPVTITDENQPTTATGFYRVR